MILSINSLDIILIIAIIIILVIVCTILIKDNKNGHKCCGCNNPCCKKNKKNRD